MATTLIVFINTFTFLLFVWNVGASPDGYHEQIEIAQGSVKGTMKLAARCRFGPSRFLGENYYEFLGIPYAEPPVGPLRFKSPEPPKSWKGVRDAVYPGSECLQSFSSIKGSEDCLYINVYTPLLPRGNLALKPVMVWIHGGAFKTGNGYSDFGPEYLVSKGILLVTFNYRLGVLGFLSLEDDILSGNYGMKDQVQALKWVKENIEHFGGDPKKVTLFGHSAGGASVNYHLLSSLSNGLFMQAIIQSGTALSPWAFNPDPKATAVSLAEVMGVSTTDTQELHDFFMNADGVSLIKASDTLFHKQFENLRNFTSALFVPCAEVLGSGDKFITRPPSEALEHDYASVPLILGVLNSDGSVILSAKNFTKNEFTQLNEFPDWSVPLNWRIEKISEKERLGKEIKQYFFGELPISLNTANSLVEYFTDTYFLMDMQQLLMGHLRASDVPIYMYEFKLATSKSNKYSINLLHRRDLELTGATHSDELPLLFSVHQNVSVPGLKSNLSLLDKEEEISDHMVQMWTTFAKKGNPNYKNLEVEWKPVSEADFTFLEIDSDLKISNGRIEQLRLSFWHDLCKSTTTLYNCDSLL